jgi:hypothetical protein
MSNLRLHINNGLSMYFYIINVLCFILYDEFCFLFPPSKLSFLDGEPLDGDSKFSSYIGSIKSAIEV